MQEGWGAIVLGDLEGGLSMFERAKALRVKWLKCLLAEAKLCQVAMPPVWASSTADAVPATSSGVRVVPMSLMLHSAHKCEMSCLVTCSMWRRPCLFPLSY